MDVERPSPSTIHFQRNDPTSFTLKKSTRKSAIRKPASRRMAKANGPSAVEAWLERVKPELQPLVRRLDQLLLEAMPDAVCELKWNVPFYGLPGQGWIAAINSFNAHVKLLFSPAAPSSPCFPRARDTTPLISTPRRSCFWARNRSRRGCSRQKSSPAGT